MTYRAVIVILMAFITAFGSDISAGSHSMCDKNPSCAHGPACLLDTVVSASLNAEYEISSNKSFYPPQSALVCSGVISKSVMHDMTGYTGSDGTTPRILVSDYAKVDLVKRDGAVYQLPVGTELYALSEMVTKGAAASIAVSTLPPTAQVDAAQADATLMSPVVTTYNPTLTILEEITAVHFGAGNSIIMTAPVMNTAENTVQVLHLTIADFTMAPITCNRTTVTTDLLLENTFKTVATAMITSIAWSTMSFNATTMATGLCLCSDHTNDVSCTAAPINATTSWSGYSDVTVVTFATAALTYLCFNPDLHSAISCTTTAVNTGSSTDTSGLASMTVGAASLHAHFSSTQYALTAALLAALLL